MHHVGVDIIEIYRIERVIALWGERFLKRVYTETEFNDCQGRAPGLAVRFAAKEAVMKVLGTGIKGVGWREIEVVSNRDGKPSVAERVRRPGVLVSVNWLSAFPIAGSMPSLQLLGAAVKIVSTNEMQDIERGSADQGIPTEVLMENAGLAFAQKVKGWLGSVVGQQILFLVGPGNNGGDGLVAARHLHDWGAKGRGS